MLLQQGNEGEMPAYIRECVYLGTRGLVAGSSSISNPQQEQLRSYFVYCLQATFVSQTEEHHFPL